MSPGAQELDYILRRFSNGLGVHISKQYDVRSTRGVKTQTIELYMVPENLCRDGSKGLIIVAGKGHYLWNGKEALTPFKLIGAGILPMELAHDIAAIANMLVDRASELLTHSRETLQIEGPKES